MLHNVLHKHGMKKEIVTLVTLTLVDINDSAFKNPTKRIGKIYNSGDAEKLAAEKGWIFKEEVKTEGGWRRAVPSPKPLKIMNSAVVETMARSGTIVIAAGGGGIPVYIDEEGKVRPAEAVVDKDLASALLASNINANEFYILTDVPYVYINYKKENQQVVEFLDKADTEKYLAQGMFSEGSMAPKIRACLDFIDRGGEKSVITEAFKLEDKRYGTKITLHYDD
jgi:carbamate kinase